MLRNSNYLDPVRIGNKTNAVQSSPGDSKTRGVSRGQHDLHDVHKERIDNKWPRTFVFTSLNSTVNGVSTTTVTEGSSIVFTLVTEHIPNGTTLVYAINTTSGTTMNSDDFGGDATTGTFTTTNNSTTLSFGVTAEASPGDAESNKFKLVIFTTNDGTNADGTGIKIESAEITVTDAIAAGTDIRSSFYEISNRYIVDSTAVDYTGAYDVGEVQQSYSGSASIYIALKCTTSTTYINDICIAAVQVLNSSNVVQQTWHFTNSTTSWTTGVRSNANSSLLSSYLTPSQAASNTYYSITTSANNTRISLGSSTSSSYTGMAGGISSSVTSFPVGNGTVSQTGSAYYLFGEVSGATRYTHVIMKSPSYTFTAGDKIKVVHAVVTRSNMTSSININDSIWIGIY